MNPSNSDPLSPPVRRCSNASRRPSPDVPAIPDLIHARFARGFEQLTPDQEAAADAAIAAAMERLRPGHIPKRDAPPPCDPQESSDAA